MVLPQPRKAAAIDAKAAKCQDCTLRRAFFRLLGQLRRQGLALCSCPNVNLSIVSVGQNTGCGQRYRGLTHPCTQTREGFPWHATCSSPLHLSPGHCYQFKRSPRDLLLLGICLIFVTPGNLGIFSCKHLQVLLCWRSQTCVSAARRDVRRCLLSACRVRTPAALPFSKLVPNLQVHQSRDTMSCLQSLLAEGCYFGLNATRAPAFS